MPYALGASDRVRGERETLHLRLEFMDELGRVIREDVVPPSAFERAVYATFFDGLCRGVFPDYSPTTAGARLEPVFGDADPARLAAFQIFVPAAAGEYSLTFSSRYFSAWAERVRQELIRTEQLPPAALLRYQLVGYVDDAAAEPDASGVSLGDAAFHVSLTPGRIAEIGPTDAWDAPESSALMVFVHRSLLDELVEETRHSPEEEVGGFLLGHLCRDESSGRVYVRVSGSVSGAGTTQATGTSVTFTPDTFRLGREMVALRGNDEIFVGWFHSHPFKLCAECPVSPDGPPAECVNKILFFSSDDVSFMTESFCQAYMVGLLTAVEQRLEAALGHLPLRLFGWKVGVISPRGFYVIND